MLNLPVKLIYFWYPQAFLFFTRVTLNTLRYLEEDLAVGLMWKLILVPLFHDSTVIGRFLSLLFRVNRILIGALAFFLAILLISLLALFWFINPFLVFLSPEPRLNIFFLLSFLFGLGIFLTQVIYFPPKKVKELKEASEIWKTTKFSNKDIALEKLLASNEVKEILKNLEISQSDLPEIKIPLTDESLKIIFNLAKEFKASYISTGYFFLGFLLQKPLIEKDLLKLNLTPEDFKKTLEFLEMKKKANKSTYIWDEDFVVTHLKGVNRGWLGSPTPFLDSASEDLTRKALKTNFEDFVGREEVVSEVVNILSSEQDRNVIIVGPAGSGKTELVNFLAKKIIAGNAPSSLATKRLLSLNLDKLLIGVNNEGALAEKIEKIFEEVRFVKEIIIFVDEFHNLGTGDLGSNFNLYSLILPHLESGEFQFIAATEAENYAKIIEKNSALARIFTKVELTPPTKEETQKILQSRGIELEKQKKIVITYRAIKTLVELAEKNIKTKVLPDSALSVFNEAKVLIKNNKITEDIIKEVIAKRVNIPTLDVGNVAKVNLLNLEERLHQNLINQEEAVKAVADTLRRGAVSLKDPNRPIGSFLFVGPTGVGKTELAKTLAKVYFSGKTDSFLRFDMSEYQSDDSVNKLIGGEEFVGTLTESIKNKPYSLILLDEFEKADPKVLNLFLQVLDDGRLTDFYGKTIDFTNTIIIATSNAASLTIAEGLNMGKSYQDLKTQVSQELLEILKPELINRFDNIILFTPLTFENLEKIVKIKLKDLQSSLKQKGYLINFTNELVAQLGKKGFDPVLGARPLRRLIQDTLEAKISIMILEEKLKKGEDTTLGLESLDK